MASEDNFKWLVNDINDTLVLKVISKENDSVKSYGVYNVCEVLETTGDELEVKTANIDDLTSFLTLGIVRFVNVASNGDIIDIPFRNLYLLYKKGNFLEEVSENKYISFDELDLFSVIDGSVRSDCFIGSGIVNEVSDDLKEVMQIAYDFGDYGMQEKFDALSKITMINHRRIFNDKRNKGLK